MTTPRLATVALALTVLTVGLPARAGRPLGTDDTATVDSGCQLEAWSEHGRGQTAAVLAPACALTPKLELDTSVAFVRPRADATADFGVALKWVPRAAQWASPLGTLRLGAKLGMAGARLQGGGWRSRGSGLAGLLTLQAAPALALHLNVGPDFSRSARNTSTLVSTAVAWSPDERAQLFVEALASDRRGRNGGTVRVAGGRWWAVPETFALDLTAARTGGLGGTVWGLGFGWYGLFGR